MIRSIQKYLNSVNLPVCDTCYHNNRNNVYNIEFCTTGFLCGSLKSSILHIMLQSVLVPNCATNKGSLNNKS